MSPENFRFGSKNSWQNAHLAMKVQLMDHFFHPAFSDAPQVNPGEPGEAGRSESNGCQNPRPNYNVDVLRNPLKEYFHSKSHKKDTVSSMYLVSSTLWISLAV